MATASLTTGRQTCFQFKASFLPCMILQITIYDLKTLESQIADAVQRAPNFFIGSPVVMDLEKVKELGVLNFAKLKQILIANGLVPMGVRGGSEEQHIAAASESLPALTMSRSAFTEKEKKKTTDEKTYSTKLITSPIRSGVQVYAKDSDLIVTAQVSPGAELLADGHIHVYGALRGRALAGMQGNANARIFCRTLEAELVSIAGYYLTKEDMHKLPAYDGMIQIYLENEQVKIESV
jgi:septum site-determining protein MinC